MASVTYYRRKPGKPGRKPFWHIAANGNRQTPGFVRFRCGDEYAAGNLEQTTAPEPTQICRRCERGDNLKGRDDGMQD
jgi:hypothetical protein